jgi:hypothetical protein
MRIKNTRVVTKFNNFLCDIEYVPQYFNGLFWSDLDSQYYHTSFRSAYDCILKVVEKTQKQKRYKNLIQVISPEEYGEYIAAKL